MVPKSKRGKSGFGAVDNADRIDDKILDICLRMPKRYTYLILQPLVNHAGDAADYVREGNSVFPKNKHEAQIRRDYVIRSYCSLQALSRRINRFLTHPQVLTHTIGDKTVGVKAGELEELAKMINEEFAMLKDMLGKDEIRYKNLL